jgi:hypothetical protein
MGVGARYDRNQGETKKAAGAAFFVSLLTQCFYGSLFLSKVKDT